MIAVTTYAQNEPSPSLNIGDPAPSLHVREWLKGKPVQRFEKGNVYVLEFWATWCAPCRAAMPHLSALAYQYKDRITFIGIDVMERKTTTIEKIRDFVDSMGQRMDYNVAVEDSNFMMAGWMQASEEWGIPTTFIVNADGRLAWIGHPKNLSKVLPKILNNNWNIREAAAKRHLDKHLFELDTAKSFILIDYLGKPDSLLLAINEIVRKEPMLQYAPFVAAHTFGSLLQTNIKKAYEYGKILLKTSTYKEPAYDVIISAIEYYSEKLNLPVEIYRLGAEAYQAQIDGIAYPELHNMAKDYNKIAEWYGCSGDKLQAIAAQQKAIEALKTKKNLSVTEMAAFKVRLQQYKNM